MSFDVKDIVLEERKKINNFILKRWLSLRMILRGKIVDLKNIDGFYIEDKNNIIAVITYRIVGFSLEIISLDSVYENKGIGSLLINKIKAFANECNLKNIIVITTNNNLRALGFYQKRGFILNKVFFDSIKQARKLKPEIPIKNKNGILIRDEIELKFVLSKI